MAYAMTKQGSLDNCITYEFMCDTVADMNAIENRYRTIGTVAIVLSGESGMEVYIAGSDKQWNSLSSIGGGTGSDTAGLVIHICAQDEVSNGSPDVELPDETTIYLVPASDASSGNLYDEYIYVDDEWEKFGSANIDLSGYYQKPVSGIPANDLASGVIPDVSGFAPKDSPVFTSAISMGRLANSTIGTKSVAIGENVTASGYNSYAEGTGSGGSFTINNKSYQSSGAHGQTAHSEGNSTWAIGQESHAEGRYTQALDIASHSEGDSTKALGPCAHAEGNSTSASSNAHAEGYHTNATSDSAHAEGYYTRASGFTSHAEGYGGTYTKNNITYTSEALGQADHIEGYQTRTTSSQPGNHAEGYQTAATGGAAHAEGNATTASGNSSHAEGSNTTASNHAAHAEGASTTASNTSAHAEGNMTTASGDIAHAEGLQTIASGQFSHAEGFGTIANLTAMHAGGQYNVIYPNWVGGTSYKVDDLVVYRSTLYKCKIANSDTIFNSNKWIDQSDLSPLFVIGDGLSDSSRSNAFVIRKYGTVEEGVSTQAIAPGAHAEGINTKATASKAHAEGGSTQATGENAHTEGDSTIASGNSSHAEGLATTASGTQAHAEGVSTTAQGAYSHTEGFQTTANAQGAHAEGYGINYGTKIKNGTTYTGSGAHGAYSHTEGSETWTLSDYAHAEGKESVAFSTSTHAEGYRTQAIGSYSHAEGYGSSAQITVGETTYNSYGAYGEASHSEGMWTLAIGQNAHAEGGYTIARGDRSHAEGYGVAINETINNTTYTRSGAYGTYSHVEGSSTLALNIASHAEGNETQATGYYSHAEGYSTKARGESTHAQGYNTIAAGDYQYVTGKYNVEDNFNYLPEWTANTEYAKGDRVKRTTVENDVTSIQGYVCKTTNNDSTFISDKWSKDNLMQYAEIVGNGNSTSRSNARALDWNGNEHLMGDVYVGCNADSTGGTKLPRIPAAPSTDGTYILQATVTNGTPTYTWVSLTNTNIFSVNAAT